MNILNGIIIISLIIIIIWQSSNQSTNSTDKSEVKYIYTQDHAKAVRQWTDEIYRIGMKHRSSKFYEHDYYNMYGIYLGQLQTKSNGQIRIFEIGIGCGMPHGAGKSILTWKEFIPDRLRLSMLDFDAICAKAFSRKLEKLYIGSQSNMTLLNEIVRDGPYDMIIDDGSHSRSNQVHALMGLWPGVKANGGIYVMEDMVFNYDNWAIDAPETSFEFMTKILHFLIFQEKASKNPKMLKTKFPFGIEKLKDIADTLLSFNCFKTACLLVKK